MNYKLIQDIAKRCYESAQRRGKDVSCEGCRKYVTTELAEYWRACRQGYDLSNNAAELLNEAAQIDDNTFISVYDAYVHNTTIDELADLLIVAATWYEAAIRTSKTTVPTECADVLFIEGVLAFIADVCVNDPQAKSLHEIANLKMRYNELRLD